MNLSCSGGTFLRCPTKLCNACIKIGFGFLLWCCAVSTYATVVSIDKQGFYIKIEEKVKGTPEEAYAKFIQIHQWWNAEHTWFGSAENLSLDTKAGGCFCEIEGDKSVLHMQVAMVNPGKRFTMIGGLGPLQGMGLTGALTFTFEKVSPISTLVKQEYVVSGHLVQGFESLAGVVDQVQTLQMKGLIKFIEK